jgi:hypothetical protein
MVVSWPRELVTEDRVLASVLASALRVSLMSEGLSSRVARVLYNKQYNRGGGGR